MKANERLKANPLVDRDIQALEGGLDWAKPIPMTVKSELEDPKIKDYSDIDFAKQENQDIENNDRDFEMAREQNYEQKLFDLAETLNEKYLEYGERKQAISELKFSEEQLKSTYMFEAKNNGVKLITERKDYAKSCIANTQLNRNKRNLIKETMKLEWEMKGFEIRFKALKTVMDFKRHLKED